MELLERISSETWIATAIGSLIGAVVSYWFYVRSRRGGRLAFAYGGSTLIGFENAELPREVRVEYAGQVVPRLAKTEIILWNAGEALLRGEDIAPMDPVRVELADDATILDVMITRVTRDANHVEVRA